MLVGRNTTGTNGFFNITVPNTANQIPTMLSLFPCMVSVNLPLNVTMCPTLSARNGTLTGVVGSVTQVLTREYGSVQAVRIAAFGSVSV